MKTPDEIRDRIKYIEDRMDITPKWMRRDARFEILGLKWTLGETYDTTRPKQVRGLASKIVKNQMA